MLFITSAIYVFLTIAAITEGSVKRQRQAYYGGYSDKYSKKEYKDESHQDLSKLPGRPGVDFPIYHEVPETNFHCGNVPYAPGMYANLETGCQAYHICHDGREGHQGASFLCANGTLFNQKEFACDWWYNVDCGKSTAYYDLNTDPEKNPFVPKLKSSEETYKSYDNYYKPKYHK